MEGTDDGAGAAAGAGFGGVQGRGLLPVLHRQAQHVRRAGAHAPATAGTFGWVDDRLPAGPCRPGAACGGRGRGAHQRRHQGRDGWRWSKGRVSCRSSRSAASPKRLIGPEEVAARSTPGEFGRSGEVERSAEIGALSVMAAILPGVRGRRWSPVRWPGGTTALSGASQRPAAAVLTGADGVAGVIEMPHAAIRQRRVCVERVWRCCTSSLALTKSGTKKPAGTRRARVLAHPAAEQEWPSIDVRIFRSAAPGACQL